MIKSYLSFVHVFWKSISLKKSNLDRRSSSTGSNSGKRTLFYSIKLIHKTGQNSITYLSNGAFETFALSINLSFSPFSVSRELVSSIFFSSISLCP